MRKSDVWSKDFKQDVQQLHEGLPLPSETVVNDSLKAVTGICCGTYMDIKHGGALRTISAFGEYDAIIVKGKDCPNTAEWIVLGRIEGSSQKIKVDFSPKGGPKEVIGSLVEDGVLWQDGNKWLKSIVGNAAG